ncbi:MAG: amidohydrolase family protein [Mycobacterium sp.]
MPRIDTHHHIFPPDYLTALASAGIQDSGGHPEPDWSEELMFEAMDQLDIATAIMSVSTPGVSFLPNPADAAALARDINDYSTALVASNPQRCGFFATIPTPHITESIAEAERALDDLHADGVVLLANSAGIYNSAGTYLGEPGQEDLFACLDQRAAVVFIHPNDLPGPRLASISPFVADFLLDSVRAAYLLVRNGIRRQYPNIKFILSHAGGFVPYVSYRLAMVASTENGRAIADNLEDFASFYFDTASSSTAASLPSLLAFAKPGHVIYGSDFPYSTVEGTKLNDAGLDDFAGLDATAREAIERTNARVILPRLDRA